MNKEIALSVFENHEDSHSPPSSSSSPSPGASSEPNGKAVAAPAEATKIKYVLRFGNRTWAPVLVISITLSLSILGFVYNYFGVTCIYMTHFWPNAPSPLKKPHPLGAERYVIAFVAMLGMYFIHQVILRSFLDSPAKVMNAHIAYILIGFFFGAWEDVCFEGKLLGWTGVVRGVAWYVITWGVWCILMLGITGIHRDHYNAIFVNWFLSWLQMAIVTQLWVGIWFKDILQMFKHISIYIRGIVLTGLIVLNGVALSHIIYGFTVLYCEECKPGDMWHFGVACGSYPLIPILCMGLYGNAFRELKQPALRVVCSWAYVQAVAVSDFFLFHLICSPMHMMGHQQSWFHDNELVVNFTIALLLLTWNWFTQRWLFVKAELPPSVLLVTPSSVSPSLDTGASGGGGGGGKDKAGSAAGNSNHSDDDGGGCSSDEDGVGDDGDGVSSAVAEKHRHRHHHHSATRRGSHKDRPADEGDADDV
ncbi:hypothetical protein Pelo_30 [Pelomyxa schiedti]|nr:hypothetical protein Pelo_30 [Pelomyxa schiedti]